MTIMEKLKEVLEAEDLQKLNDYVNQMVTEEVKKCVAILAEERTKKLDELADKYVAQRIEEEKKKLQKDQETALAEMEDRLIGQLDSFLEEEINENISDEMLEKVALNETLLPIVNGVQKVFEEQHIALDSEGSAVVKKLQDELDESKTRESKLIAEKMEMSELMESTATKTLIAEKTEGLNDEQKARVVAFFEGKDFDTIKADIDNMIDLVVEDENKAEGEGAADDKQKLDEGAGSQGDITPEGDGIEKEKPVIEENERPSIAKLAQHYV